MRFAKTAVGAGILALVATATPAWAAPYTVTVNGSSAAGTHSLSATSSAVTITINNSGGDRVITCTGVTLSGTVTSGTNVSNPIGTVSGSTWSGCTYDGQSVTITPDRTRAWSLNCTGSATGANTDNVACTVSGIALFVSTFGGFCTFDLTGSANAALDEANQQVDIFETAGNLMVSNTSFGCFGLFNDFDTADLVTSLEVSPTLYLF